MHIYNSSYRRRYHRSIIPKLLQLSLVIIIGGVLFVLFRRLTTAPLVSPIALAQTPQLQNIRVTPTITIKTASELEKRIIDQIDSTVPKYSIIVDDFLRPLRIELGDQIIYEGASVLKIPILFTLLKQIEQETISWDKKIVFEERDRQDYGTGSIRYQPAGKQFTIRQLAELMMKQSDNTAAYIIANRVVSLQEIQDNVISWGLEDTDMFENTTTNKDINILMKQFFIGKLFTASLTREASELFRDSLYEDRLPALLPKQVKIYHKIGTAIAGLHDVGIVVTPTSLYYIGVFTKGVSDEPGATKTIGKISKAVFDYMEE